VRRIILGSAVLLVIATGMVLAATVPERRTGYLAPIFTPDGGAIAAVRHELDAWVFGPGWEMLTPPARVWVRRDRYYIVRLDRRTGEETVVATPPPSPIEDTWMSAYRSSGYGASAAGLSWRGGVLAWRVTLTSAGSEPQRVFEITSTSMASGWSRVPSAAMSGDDHAVLSGDDEVVVVPSAPCAVLLLNDARKSVRVVSPPERCGRSQPPIDYATVRQYARRAGLERLAAIEAIRAEMTRAARAHGASEMEAELEAIDALERAGYYARPPQLVATPLPPAEVAARRARKTLTPLFTITAMEFRVGLFPDIEQAIASPGTEIRYHGPYLRHTDFTTSDALNALLASGAQDFFVETPTGFAAIHLVPSREPTR